MKEKASRNKIEPCVIVHGGASICAKMIKSQMLNGIRFFHLKFFSKYILNKS